MRSFSNVSHLAAIGVGLLALPNTAMAAQKDTPDAAKQQANPEPSDQSTENSNNNEIVVTAQKRAQNIKDVPLSISVIDAKFQQDNNIRDFADLARFTPGFTSAPDGLFIVYSSIRGVSSNEFGFATDPSIGLYVDGVYQGLSGSQVNAFYDIERAEVVNGPQATLFGRASIAGTINTILVKPKSTFGGYVQAGVGSPGRYAGEGAINVPLTDTLFARVSGQYESRDGWVRNLAGGDRLGGGKLASGRVQLRYEGNQGLTVDLRVGAEDRRGTTTLYQSLDLDGFTVNINPTGRAGNRANARLFDTVLAVSYAANDRLTLTSTSSYRFAKNDGTEKYDGLPQIVGYYLQGQTDRLYQQDLRATWLGDNGLSVIVGGSWSQLDRTAFIGEFADQTLVYTGAIDIAATPTDFSQALIERGKYTGNFRDLSAYADVTVPVTSAFKLTGGIRYAHNRKRFSSFVQDPATIPENNGLPIFFLYGYYTSNPIADTRSWSNVSVRAAANYDITDDITAYAAFNQGWKPGGFSTIVVANPPPLFTYTTDSDASAFGSGLQPVNPETSNSYEIGLKGALFDRRLRFAVSGYYYRYENLQRIRQEGVQNFVDNIDAKGLGLEADLRLRVSDNLKLFSNFAINDTEILTDPFIATNIGLPLNLAPRFNGTFGFDLQSIAIGALGGGTLYLGGSAVRRSTFRTDESIINNIPGYWTGNLNAGWQSSDERVRVNLFVNNVSDQFTYNRQLDPNDFLAPRGARAAFGAPREIGLDVTFSFGSR